MIIIRVQLCSWRVAIFTNYQHFWWIKWISYQSKCDWNAHVPKICHSIWFWIFNFFHWSTNWTAPQNEINHCDVFAIKLLLVFEMHKFKFLLFMFRWLLIFIRYTRCCCMFVSQVKKSAEKQLKETYIPKKIQFHRNFAGPKKQR